MTPRVRYTFPAPSQTAVPGRDPPPVHQNVDVAKVGYLTIIYDRTSPDCGEVNRGATGDFRQHHFTFFLVTNPGKARTDIALFLGLAESFVYSGSA